MAAIAAVAAPLVLAGCGGGTSAEPGAPASSAASSSAPSSGASTPSPTLGADAPVMVSLGDSYTAAPLVPDTDTTDGCLRSTGNYPHLVAAELGYRLTDVSCSGATTTALVGVQSTADGGTQAPQFLAVTEDADVVTLSIGGNDGDLFATLVGQCSLLAQDDPSGTPCSDRFGGDDAAPAKALRVLPGHLEAAVAGIRDRAPDARVVVVGYPQIVPATGSCPELLPIAEGDYAFARSLNERLAGAMRTAARASGADYIDAFRLTRGHDVCADDPWINGPQTQEGVALAFHPLAAEQQAIADALVDLLG